MVYVIPGDPIALARPRHGSSGKVYDSQKNTKLICGITLRNQHEGPTLTGPLHLDITFFMESPKRPKGKLHYHVFRPDLDNLIKFYADVAQSICFDDDKLIAKITAQKIYTTLGPRTEFTLTRLTHGQ